MTVDQEPTYKGDVTLEQLAELRPGMVRWLDDGSAEVWAGGRWHPFAADALFVVPMSEWLTRTT